MAWAIFVVLSPAGLLDRDAERSRLAQTWLVQLLLYLADGSGLQPHTVVSLPAPASTACAAASRAIGIR
jgi:hypothetical protein